MPTTHVKRTFSMREDVETRLAAHTEATGATRSDTVNEALFDYLERQAIAAAEEWEQNLPAADRAKLQAWDAQDDPWTVE